MTMASSDVDKKNLIVNATFPAEFRHALCFFLKRIHIKPIRVCIPPNSHVLTSCLQFLGMFFTHW
jgi:hypothetical protein